MNLIKKEIEKATRELKEMTDIKTIKDYARAVADCKITYNEQVFFNFAKDIYKQRELKCIGHISLIRSLNIDIDKSIETTSFNKATASLRNIKSYIQREKKLISIEKNKG